MNTYYLAGSVGQECGNHLAGWWFWLRVPHEVAIKQLGGAAGILEASQGLDDPLLVWLIHMAFGRRPQFHATWIA